MEPLKRKKKHPKISGQADSQRIAERGRGNRKICSILEEHSDCEIPCGR